MAFGNTTSGELCMSLPVALIVGAGSQSFEEVRIADYLASYRATGRPPPPVPALPADPAARAAQRLPPLFVPAPFPGAPSSFGGGLFGSQQASTSASAIRDPASLPVAQAFAAPVTLPADGGAPGATEAFASIAAVGEYAFFSHEELRYYAYLRGARHPPPGTPAFPFVPLPSPVSASVQSQSTTRKLPVPESGEQFSSLTTREAFCEHSLEEHRLSYLRTGRELTSAQIFASAAGSPSASIASALSAPAQPRPLFSHSQPPPQPAQPTQNLFAPSQPVHTPFTLGGAPAPQPQAVQTQQPLGAFSFGGAPAPPPTQHTFGMPAAPVPQQSMFGAPPPQQQSMFGGGGGIGGGAGSGFAFGAAATPAATGGGLGFGFGARRM